ncbi:MAG: hypothetical protein ACRC9M_06570, partial [Aeromonas sp.]
MSTGKAGGYTIKLAAGGGEEAPAVIVRVTLGHPLVMHIEEYYPVKTLAAARRFVSTAGQAEFDRAIVKMAGGIESAQRFIDAMSQAIHNKGS